MFKTAVEEIIASKSKLEEGKKQEDLRWSEVNGEAQSGNRGAQGGNQRGEVKSSCRRSAGEENGSIIQDNVHKPCMT